MALSSSLLSRPVAELVELDAVLAQGAASPPEVGFQARMETQVSADGQALPVWSIALGSAAADAPVLGLFGGVHGLERIGAAVVLAWLRHLLAALAWDGTLADLLARTRLVVMPVVNPGGLVLGTRANPAGVDLMRNAPIDADARVPRLAGGHRLGRALPWYRGRQGAPMEPEAAALCAVVERECRGRPFAVFVDCHSGFGMRDRIWFPHACTRTPTRVLPELQALVTLFEDSHPNHPYRFEPQSAQYLAHGDLWDLLHRRLDAPDHPVLPITLEMGSWLWVRKNPRQAFTRAGMFNPRGEHRYRRVLRRHLPLFDFLLHAVAHHRAWLPVAAAREEHARQALSRWYPPR